MDIALRFDYGEDKLADLPLEELIAFVLASRKLPQTTSVSVTFVSNEHIHELNRDYRGIDKPPMCSRSNAITFRSKVRRSIRTKNTNWAM